MLLFYLAWIPQLFYVGVVTSHFVAMVGHDNSSGWIWAIFIVRLGCRTNAVFPLRYLIDVGCASLSLCYQIEMLIDCLFGLNMFLQQKVCVLGRCSMAFFS